MSSTGTDSSRSSAKRRDHNDGSKDRAYTPEQHAAVRRVMSCRVTAYYEILNIVKPSSEGEIRKSYRRMALTMHPDKNGAPQADEAFKRVSKAFQVLSDADKKRIFDQTGSDPDQRGGGAGPSSQFFRQAQPGNPFGGGFGGGAEFDPNDIFNMFFGGGGGGSPFGGGGFGGSPFGASPFGNQFGGARMYTFGGGGRGFRPQTAAGARARQQQQEEPDRTVWQSIWAMLPVVLLLLVPSLFSLFDGGGSSPSIPRFTFEPRTPFVTERFTPRYAVPFYVDPRDVEDLSVNKLRRLDRQAETSYISMLRNQCNQEHMEQQQLAQDAMGWWSRDEEKYQRARNMHLPNCERLDRLGIRLQD